MRFTLTLAFALAACDPGALNGEPAPCSVPVVGDTCPLPLDARPSDIELRAWCIDGAPVRADHGGGIEWSCTPAEGERRYRYVAGVLVPGVALAFLTPGGSLIQCGPDGMVEAVSPLLADAGGRVWHALEPEDDDCLDSGTCAVLSEQCGADPHR